MRFLVDTNVPLEVRKGPRCDPNVAAWNASCAPADLFVSVLVLGEIRNGIERLRRRDAMQATALERWLAVVAAAFAGRILAVDAAVADAWARLRVPDRLPAIDGLLAATAQVHDLVLATRDVAAIVRSGLRILNPFEPTGARGQRIVQ